MGKIKILYIASFSRSGTTILGNVLGEVNGFFHAGELWQLWNEGVLGNSSCGCGAPFAGCPVWSAVMNKAYGGLDNAEAQEMTRWRDTELRTRNTVLRPLLPGGERRLRLRVEDRVPRVARLYHAIQAVTGCKVIVDSSKVPAYVHALRMAPSLDVYILHLVRDSRAVAFSSQRKPDALAPYSSPKSPMSVALAWTIQNVAAARLANANPRRYLMLRYATFIREPVRSVERILGMLGESTSELPFVDDHTVHLGTNHVFSGNYSRFRTGRVELKVDDEWETRMRWGHRSVVTAITWPLLLRHR
jgi:hypothetical protein